MTVTDFYSLPRSGQDRLLDSCRGALEPRPLAIALGIRPTAELWGALAIGAGVAFIAAWAIGFGQLGNVLARHPVALVVLFAGLGFLIGLGVVQALAYRAAIAGLPFPPGIYLFGANVIDAREAKLRVYALPEATSIQAKSDTKFVVAFGATRFTFRVEPGHLEQALALVEANQKAMMGEPDDDTRRDRDPLMALSVAAPLAPTTPLEPPAPGWLRARMAVPALLALVTGGLFFLRDGMSDGSMFEAARRKNDVEAYRAYLEQGDRHRDEVTKIWLPRAELVIAMKEGTVEAIDELIAAHPEATITDEIDVARKNALVKAFEKVRAEGTFAALIGFDTTYPKHHLGADVGKAKKAIYDKAFVTFEKGIPERSTKLGPFVKRLMAVAAKSGAKKTADGVRGPAVEVRMQHIPSKGIDNADKVVRRNPYYAGKPSLLSRHLDEPHLTPAEAKAAKALAEGIAKGFSAEILTFATGERVAGKERPEVKVPTLFVGYRVEPSGSAYASRKPRGIYMGLVFFFDMLFVLPGQDEPYRIKHVIESRVPVDVLAAQKPPFKRGAVEEALYAAMVERGFEQLRERYLAGWYQ